jgi:hypothetical protein
MNKPEKRPGISDRPTRFSPPPVGSHCAVARGAVEGLDPRLVTGRAVTERAEASAVSSIDLCRPQSSSRALFRVSPASWHLAQGSADHHREQLASTLPSEPSRHPHCRSLTAAADGRGSRRAGASGRADAAYQPTRQRGERAQSSPHRRASQDVLRRIRTRSSA